MNKKLSLIIPFIFLLMGCSNITLTRTADLPAPSRDKMMTLFTLNNYTLTPQAGLRAANLVEGVLIGHGFKVITAFNEKTNSLSEQLEIAKSNGSHFIMTGGLSEWRYKTGIDGEPAISLQLKLINVQTGEVTWNATASANDWGNASIGAVAQSVIEKMTVYTQNEKN
jgi:PBP1b-binding outer membrane lipoprotein LpoB